MPDTTAITTAAPEGQNTLFPVFLKLEHMQVLVLGAGPVGLEKLQALVRNAPNTRIRVVAEYILPEVQALATTYPTLTLVQKSYDPTDLEGAHLVLMALNNPTLSAAIKQAANARGLLVNVADTPQLCDFYLGSIVQKGNLKIAISTNGKSPTIAKRLREMLEEVLPNELEGILQKMQAIRQSIQGDFHKKVRKLDAITHTLRRRIDKSP